MLDKRKNSIYPALFEIFNTWQQKAEKHRNGEITEAEYNAWKYNYCIEH
jgi:hypothetical protein